MLETVFGLRDLSVAQECARAVLIFFYGLLMLRLSGRRTFAQMSALDLVISIIEDSNLSRAMTSSAPLWGTLAAVAVLVALHLFMAAVVARSRRLSRLIEGGPVLLAQDGVIHEAARLGCKISLADIAESLREHGLDGLGELHRVRTLMLEPSGKISVVRKDA